MWPLQSEEGLAALAEGASDGLRPVSQPRLYKLRIVPCFRFIQKRMQESEFSLVFFDNWHDEFSIFNE